MESQTKQERITELRSAMAEAQNEIERLERELADEANPNVAQAGDPSTGRGWVDNTGVDGQPPEGAPDGKQTYADEKYWTKAKLSEEIDNRNTERVAQGLDPMSKSGNRAELVERLMKDDEELED